MVVFKLTSTEVLIQSLGPDITLRSQFQHLGVHESGNIIYEDFFNRFSAAAGKFLAVFQGITFLLVSHVSIHFIWSHTSKG